MDYISYHIKSSEHMDIDPANDCLLYLSERFELTIEQRYWLAFLYSTCYCGPTVYYMYNEFPDFENVDVARLQRWWNKNKSKMIFQTDRLKIKTMNRFVETFESYKNIIGDRLQSDFFLSIKDPCPVVCYQRAYNELGKVRNIGRFTLFIYLEMISVLTDFKCVPDRLEWAHADNCRVGMYYHLGHEDGQLDYSVLDNEINRLQDFFKTRCEHSNIFNIETTLCAYKKYRHGKRYIGYYLDRQLKEIDTCAKNITEGVAWRALYEFRQETYKHLYQNENNTIDWWMR